MKHTVTLAYLICYLFLSNSLVVAGPPKKPNRLKIGTSIGINAITPEKMNYAKSVGIDYIETGITAAIDKQRLTFTRSKAEIIQLMQQAKKAADDAGINIWSIHMPFSDKIDLSRADEAARQQVVEFHKQVLEYVKILEPEIILFHPSYQLGLNEREVRKEQFIKSAIALNKSVKSIGATMVVENMLAKRDDIWVLMRTVDEAVEVMDRLPKDIYSAVDLNHIKDPEKLLRALGKRIKTLHVADGQLHEEHYFPCSGQGQNNWVEIFAALDEIDYAGPYMYECKYPDLKDLKICYDIMYDNYVDAITAEREAGDADVGRRRGDQP
ncbi:sugar phosphate isomerase/epimerase family protein [Parapedobacter sp. DT-150]|uniref:sugar phosphate isomerase/epimerase family protein n=1 Tax=Parapedobacter sp. DT-150 TaxID=3396162 RepID=UPI003F199FFE